MTKSNSRAVPEAKEPKIPAGQPDAPCIRHVLDQQHWLDVHICCRLGRHDFRFHVGQRSVVCGLRRHLAFISTSISIGFSIAAGALAAKALGARQEQQAREYSLPLPLNL